MAGFVVAFHWKPADYWALTIAEHNAIITVNKKVHKR